MATCKIKVKVTNAKLSELHKALKKSGKSSSVKFNFFQLTNPEGLAEAIQEQKQYNAEALAKDPEAVTVEPMVDMSKQVADLFSHDNATRLAAGKLLSVLISPVKSIHDKVRALLGQGNKNKIENSKLLSSLNSDKLDTSVSANRDTLLDRAIGMRFVLSAIHSEQDLISKYNLDVNPEMQEWIEKMQEGGQSTNLDKFLHIVGKESLESRNKFVSGKDPLKRYQIFRTEGHRILAEMQDAGLVTIDTHGAWIAGRPYKTTSKNDKNQYESMEIIQKEGRVIRINHDNIPEDTSDHLLVLLGQLARITTPQTEDLPTKTPQDYDGVSGKQSKHKVKVPKVTVTTIDRVQKGSFTLAEDTKQVLRYLAEMYKTSDTNFKTTLMRQFKVNDADFLEKVLGLKIKDEDSIFDTGNTGRSIARVNPLISLLENYDSMDEEIFFSFFVASNTRVFQANTSASYQSDNQMMRHIMESTNKYEFKGDEIEALARVISAESGIPYDVILGVDKKGTQVFEEMVYTHEDALNSSTMAFEEFQNIMEFGKEMGFKTEKPWEIRKYLNVIHEIRSGMETGVVSTGFMAESDATASGIILKMLQNAHLETVQNNLDRMGRKPVEGVKSLADAYGLSLEGWEEAYEKLGRKKAAALKSRITKNGTENKKVVQTNALMKAMNLKSFRDLIKYPIIQFSYHQSADNNKTSFAKQAIEGIMKDNDTQALVDFLKLYPDASLGIEADGLTIDPEVDLSKDEQKIVLKHLTKPVADSVGALLIDDILTTKYEKEMFGETEEALSAIHAQLVDKVEETDGVADIKFMPASVVVDWYSQRNEDGTFKNAPGSFDYDAHAKYRVKLTKKFEIAHETKSGHAFMPAEVANETSIYVLPIHAMDATILTRAVAKVQDMLIAEGDAKTKAEIDKIMQDNPMMLIHDAVMLSPKLTAAIGKAYEQEIMEVNYHYDIVEMMLEELKYITNKDNASKGKQYQDLPEGMKPIVEATAAAVKAKREYIGGKDFDGSSEFKVLKGSFETDTSDNAMADITTSYEKRINEAGVPEEQQNYELEFKDGKKPQPKKPKSKYSKTINPKATAVSTPETRKNAKKLVELIDSGKPYIVMDTETTGTDVDTDLLHQLSYTIFDGNKSKSVTVDIMPPALIGNPELLTDDFVKFYVKANDLTVKKGQEGRDVVYDHINAKADKSGDSAIGTFVDLVRNGTPMVAHNAPFDIAMLNGYMDGKGATTVSHLNMESDNIHDSMDLAEVVRIGELRREGKDPRIVTGSNNQETVSSVRYLKNKVNLDTLRPYYGVEVKGAHTAEADVASLHEVLNEMAADYKDGGYTDIVDTMQVLMDNSGFDATTKKSLEDAAKIIATNPKIELEMSSGNSAEIQDDGTLFIPAIPDAKELLSNDDKAANYVAVVASAVTLADMASSLDSDADKTAMLTASADMLNDLAEKACKI